MQAMPVHFSMHQITEMTGFTELTPEIAKRKYDQTMQTRDIL